MSKEQLTTIATTIIATIAVLTFLWNINIRIGSIEKNLGVLQGTVEANNESIAELRADVREIRSIVNSHLILHAKQAMLSGDSVEVQ